MSKSINKLLDLPNNTLQHIMTALAHIALLLNCGIPTLALLWTLSLCEITIANFLDEFWTELRLVRGHNCSYLCFSAWLLALNPYPLREVHSNQSAIAFSSTHVHRRCSVQISGTRIHCGSICSRPSGCKPCARTAAKSKKCKCSTVGCANISTAIPLAT